MTLGIDMLEISSSCMQKCKHMTLAMGMINIMFSFYTKPQNYHVKFPIVLY